MTKFRKKPVVIDAWPADSIVTAHRGQRPDFRGTAPALALMDGRLAPADDGGLDIATLEGVMHAAPDDWVILGVAGEFYPCKPDIFAATYEQVL
jgi:hypothetical protein